MEENQITLDVVEKMSVRRLINNSLHRVAVTHINDPGSFYVRLDCFDRELQALEVRGRPITLAELHHRKRVIYKSEIMKKYVRGDIVFIGHDGSGAPLCAIQSMDYGCQDRDVHLDDIYLVPSNSDCPPLALHCGLLFCEPKADNFDEEAIKAMRHFVGGPQQFSARINIIHRHGGKMNVELMIPGNPYDVSRMLLLAQCTCLEGYSNTVHRFAIPANLCAPFNVED